MATDATPKSTKSAGTTATASKTAGKTATTPRLRSAGTDQSAFDVRRSVTDAGYIAVGIGVLGVQQVQAQRSKVQVQRSKVQARIEAALQEHVEPLVEQLQGLPSKVSERIGEQLKAIDLTHRLDDARVRASEFGEQTRTRVAPIVDGLQTRVDALPDPLPKAAAPVVKAARQLISA